MSDKERAALADEHPKLYAAVTHGTLIEASKEFVKVAAMYPITKP